MSIPDELEALFEVVMFVATYIVDKTTPVGTGARERSGTLGNYLQLVVKETRKFHAMHWTIARD